ncbi:adenylate/guanylate cyclase domain-containing protein [bacterium]|nr:adenylate/guanylate cyclase domain-containing protein [bacterium]
MQHQKNIHKTLLQQIKADKKEATIMFTDIEASSAYWDSKGDLKGRLMVDYQNRLIFPVIKKFRGRIIKTIGDSVMAVFKHPQDAVTSAIAIQQSICAQRLTHKDLPKVKIGIHTGSLIIEKNDVFGDVVNVAKRIEDEANGDEILLSTRTARKMKQNDYFLKKGNSFQPKGKKRSITLYSCNWQAAPDNLEDLNLFSKIFLSSSQKREILITSLCSIASLIAIYLTYLRYFLADNRLLALFVLNPLHILISFPPAIILLLCLMGLITYLFIRIKKIPILFFRIMTGGLGFLLAFYIFKLPMSLHLFDDKIKADTIIFESQHRFVKTVSHNVTIHEAPADDSVKIRSVLWGTLMLQNDVSSDRNWYKILIDRQNYGWIRRIIPAQMGVPEKICSTDLKFYFRYIDMYRLIFSFLGFIAGFFRFKLKPI